MQSISQIPRLQRYWYSVFATTLAHTYDTVAQESLGPISVCQEGFLYRFELTTANPRGNDDPSEPVETDDTESNNWQWSA